MNSREIKFRVWSKTQQEWYPQYFDWQFLLGANGRLFIYSESEDSCEAKAEKIKNLDDYVVQLYAGLKDINGREIYEGDIVLLQELGFNGIPSSQKHLCEIFVKTPPNSSWFFHARPLPVDEGGRQFSLYNNQYEVVGNVYENPELVKKCGA